MELEFNEEVKGSAVLVAKSMKIDFGAARMRHLFCPMLFIQESANLRCMEECEEKYSTTDNGTKVVNAEIIQRH